MGSRYNYYEFTHCIDSLIASQMKKKHFARPHRDGMI
jgi:hypothetical protein